MLWAIFVILLVLWLLGLIGHVAGGFIHILLVIAMIVLVVRLIEAPGALTFSQWLPPLPCWRRNLDHCSHRQSKQM